MTVEWTYGRHDDDDDNNTRSRFVFRTDFRYAYDASTHTVSLSRDRDEAFLDVAMAVYVLVDHAKSSGERRHLLEWSGVSSEVTKRTFATMLHKAVDDWEHQEEEGVEVALDVTVLDMPASARFWRDVRAFGAAKRFSRRFERVAGDAAAKGREHIPGDLEDFVTSAVSEEREKKGPMRLVVQRDDVDDFLLLRLPITAHAAARESRRARKGTSVPVSSAPVCLVADEATRTAAAVVAGAMFHLSLVDRQTHCEVVGVVPLRDLSTTSRERRMEVTAATLDRVCRRFRPKRVLDFVRSLDARQAPPPGRELFDTVFSYFCACDEIATEIEECGANVGERGTRMPRWTGYTRFATSPSPSRRFVDGEKGPYAAAMFLATSVCPRLVKRGWMHFDVEDRGDGVGCCLDTAVEAACRCVNAPPPGW